MHQPSPSTTPETSVLIIEAAGPIFAQNGFHATTVRQITREAGVNIAAVNYHFHDKQELYVQVLKHAYQAAAKTAEADRPGAPEVRLRAFIRSFLGHLLDPQRPEWHGQLIARELAQPTEALDLLARESVQPVRKRLVGIILELLGPGVAEADVRMSWFSIMGQCLCYVHCHEMIVRLFPGESRIHRDVESLADHIYNFSLRGLAVAKRRSRVKSPSRRPASKTPRKKSL